jgi:hypothetical protein
MRQVHVLHLIRVYIHRGNYLYGPVKLIFSCMAMQTSKFLVWPCLHFPVTYMILLSLLLEIIAKNVGYSYQTNPQVTKIPSR